MKALLLAAAMTMAAPETAKQPVTDEYHGEKIADDYRWLEKSDDAAVLKWIDAQNAYSKAALATTPHLAELKARVRTLETASSGSWKILEHKKGLLFAMKSQPPKQQSFLVTFTSADDLKSEKVVVDPNKIDPKGNTAIDWYVPSPDGKLVAVSLSKNGTESGDVQVYDVATGKARKDLVPRVQNGTAGGSLSWRGDSNGFWYTRYPRGTEKPADEMGFWQQVYFHELGKKTEDDIYAIGKDFVRIAEVELATSEDGAWVLAQVQNGDGGEYEVHLFASGAWTRLAKFEDRVVHAQFGKTKAGTVLYLLSRKDAPRGKLLRLELASGDATPALAKAAVVLPESDGTLSHFETTDTRLFAVYLQGGPSELLSFDKDGKNPVRVGILPVSSVGQILHLKGDELLLRNESFLEPSSWYRTGADGIVKKTALASTSPVDYSDTEVVREFATSKDGTKIPVNVMKRKGIERNGKNPTILYAYGGYGVSLTPSFSGFPKPWLEQGGLYVIANIRGGGEYGDAWHKAGNLTKKQNAFDDYFAAAAHLIDTGWTSKDLLAAYGRSNGGLLMGAAITQRPELFKAVVAVVGIYDMLRVELHSNGAFNVTEFGTVKDKAQYDALKAYSPYHRVKNGTAYPAAIFITGKNDPRVDPYQSRKMAARLQGATSAKAPILIRMMDGGHGGGGSGSLEQRIEQEVDIYAFLFQQMGLEYKPVGKPANAPVKSGGL